MKRPLVKKITLMIFLGGLLWVAACTTAEPIWRAQPGSTEPWWQGKPVSQMTPAEREEQDPEFWYFWKNFHDVP